MFIDDAWVQQVVDALRETLDVDDGTRREMIQFLFDEGFWNEKTLTWTGAETRFAACLNPAKRDFFKLSEIWALMKRFRRHHLLRVMLDDLSFYPPREKPTEERRQELMQQLAQIEEKLFTALTATRAEMARLDLPDNVRIHPAIRAENGHGRGVV